MRRWLPLIDMRLVHILVLVVRLSPHSVVGTTHPSGRHDARPVLVVLLGIGEGSSPSVLHIGDTTNEWLPTPPRGPVVARRYPFCHKLFCTCLEDAYLACRESDGETIRSDCRVPRFRKSHGHSVHETVLASAIRAALTGQRNLQRR